MVLIDYYRGYIETDVVKNTSSEVTICCLEKIFGTHGLPQSLRTDNATSFASGEFTNFLLTCGIEHKKTTPLRPQANGEVKRQNKSIMRRIRIAIAESQNWQEALADYIFAYRITPHSTTVIPPVEALFGRKIRSKMPQMS